MSAEGSAPSAVKPWSSFQCTGIHHAVRARTYEGDEHLANVLKKSMASLPFIYKYMQIQGAMVADVINDVGLKISKPRYDFSGIIMFPRMWIFSLVK